jgi:hypothetical protein
MNRQECRKLLLQEGVDERFFDLDGGRNDYAYTIGEYYGLWYFYYFERGMEEGRVDFATESEACEHLLKVILNDGALSTMRVPGFKKSGSIESPDTP